MSAAVKSLIAEVRKLSTEERLELADEILKTIDPSNEDVDRLWVTEVNDRLDAYRRGDLPARDFKEVLAEYGRK